MAIEKMMLVRSSGQIDALDGFLRLCCMRFPYHPENALGYLSGSLGYTALNEENPYSALVAGIEDIAAKAGLTLSPVEADSDGGLDGETVQKYIDDIRTSLSSLSEQRAQLAEQEERCRQGIEKFSHFLDLDVNIEDLLACKYLKVRFGSIPRESYAKLAAYEYNPYLLFTPCSSDSRNYWGVYCAPREQIDDVDRIFASLYFERLMINEAVGTVSEIIDNLKKNIEIDESQIAEIDAEIAAYWGSNEREINEIYSSLRRRDAAFALRRFAAKHDEVFYCVGWVPRRKAQKFCEAATAIEGVECWMDEPDMTDKNSPPTKLHNSLFMRPFEYYVEMYGLPNYGSVDITSFVAVTYTLLFGIMFGDLGQGLVLVAVGALMWKIKHMALGKILLPCGVSSMFFGLVFGSVFGYEDMLDPLYHAVGMKGKPVSVMESINTVLLFAIFIGVALVVVSMLINIFTKLKAKRFGEALFDNNGLTGVAFYLAAVNLAVGFMGGKAPIPNGVCGIILGVGAVILFAKELLISLVDRTGYKPDSVMDFVLQNIFELLEYVLSYFSNTVSFLRVGAFVLVHAGMMMVVFSLAGGGSNIFVVVIGNALVICLEGLLTGIQALRLEFYEMFSRCYEGEGRAFVNAGSLVTSQK